MSMCVLSYRRSVVIGLDVCEMCIPAMFNVYDVVKQLVSNFLSRFFSFEIVL